MKTRLAVLVFVLFGAFTAQAFTLEDAKRLLHKRILMPCCGLKDDRLVETEISEISRDEKYVNIPGFGWIKISEVVVVSEL